jgi:hypothetical protein
MDDVTTIILNKLNSIETKLDGVITNGCSKAGQHSDIEQRVRATEKWQSDASGKLWGVTAVIGAAWTLIATYVIPWFKSSGKTP